VTAVMQVISSAGFYGAESMLLNLARAQRARGDQVRVAVFNNAHIPNLEVAERASAVGLAVEVIDCAGRFNLRAIGELKRLMSAHSIDVLHSHGFKADFYAALASFGKRDWSLVATCHNWRHGTTMLALYNQADYFALRRFDAAVAVSSGVADELRAAAVPADRVHVIDNGIDISELTHAQRPAQIPLQVLGMVSRLDWAKGFEPLFAALTQVRAKHPQVRVEVVGDGPDRDALEARARELGLHDVIHFAGRRTDMPAAYASFDALVLPSLNEGLPMTILEAMACGRPVIASAIGGIPSVIQSDSNGLLVPPGDSDALAGAICRLAEDASLCARLAAAGPGTVERGYSAAVMAQNYERVYQALRATARKAA
jgi:glycosyltransferase involved in cell wall biosynthesis